jgi:hypothetical protein
VKNSQTVQASQYPATAKSSLSPNHMRKHIPPSNAPPAPRQSTSSQVKELLVFDYFFLLTRTTEAVILE